MNLNPQTQLRQKIQQSIIAVIEKLFEVKNQTINLEHPKVESQGDYSTNIAMKLGGNPRELATKIVEALQQDPELQKIVEKIELAGPGFINFYLKQFSLINEIETIKQQKENYGLQTWGNGQTWLIEHTSPNPNKAMHLGHLRNNVTSMAISNLWEAIGIKVIRGSVDNDRGIAIAKLMWGYLKFAHKEGKHIEDISYWAQHQDEWQTPEDAQLPPDKFMDQMYVQGSNDFKNPEVEKKVRQFVVDWEAGDTLNWQLWQKVLDYVYLGQNKTLKRLSNKWDKVWHEHEHYDQFKDLLEKGLKEGIFKKLEDGAILTNLEKYNIPDTIVQKRDGTSLYITQDLALNRIKINEFHPDRLFWVIGPEQTLAMKQTFAVCEQLGIGKVSDYTHIAYGYMSIKGQGKMSSRSGNVIYIDDLIDEAKQEIQTKMLKGKLNDKEVENIPDNINKLKHGIFTKDEIETIGEQIALGAVKYSMLKISRLTDTAFDFQTSLALEGNSGPYLQYTYARTQSVLHKAKGLSQAILNTEDYKPNPEELAVLKYLYRYEEVIAQAALENNPSDLCTYLYELAQRFNVFYNQCTILNDPDEQIRTFRLGLTSSVGQIIKNGLKILGIDSPERM